MRHAFLVVALLLSAGSATAVTCADADLAIPSDCAVTVQDAQAVIACWSGATAQLECDVDHDGDVDVFDVQAVVKAVLDCQGVDACVVCAELQPSDPPVYLKAGWVFGASSVSSASATLYAQHEGYSVAHLGALQPGEWVQTGYADTAPIWVALNDIYCVGSECVADVCASTTPSLLPF